MNMWRTWLAALTIFFTFGVALAAPRPIELKLSPLPGVWIATITPSGDDAQQPGAATFTETLSFKGDKMTTKVLLQKGFGPATYDEDRRSVGPSQFTCTQTSDKEGSAAWVCTATETDMQGTLVITHKDGSITHYDVQGQKQPFQR